MKSKNTYIPRVTIRVIDPETNYSVDAEEWMKKPEEIRTKAEWINVESDLGYEFQLHKSNAPGGDYMSFAEAQEASASVCEGGRCGTRFEFLLIQYCRENFRTSLDELLIAIGGDPFRENWFWTEEKHQSYATHAWVCNGAIGFLYTIIARVSSLASRVLRAL